MAQLLNRLRAEERIAGVEFWHSPERCGWLMKQGMSTDLLSFAVRQSERESVVLEALGK